MTPARSALPLVCLALTIAAKADEYRPPEPSSKIAILRETWRDAARERDVPVKIYYPAQNAAPAPVVIFSHGLGGNRDHYEYLGQHWAGCGYVSVHVQHLGSDDALWRGSSVRENMRQAVLDVRNAINRLNDVSFAIDRLLALNADPASPLHGRIDAARIGVAGHSFGGWTTLAALGEKLPLVGVTLADSRLKAGVAISAPMPAAAERATAFSGIKVPVFHITGTADDSPLGETKAAQRRIAFDKMKSRGTCLLIFKDADHMSFAVDRGTADHHLHAVVCDATTAFWDTHLRGSKAARDWLAHRFAAQLAADGTFETK